MLRTCMPWGSSNRLHRRHSSLLHPRHLRKTVGNAPVVPPQPENSARNAVQRNRSRCRRVRGSVNVELLQPESSARSVVLRSQRIRRDGPVPAEQSIRENFARTVAQKNRRAYRCIGVTNVAGSQRILHIPQNSARSAAIFLTITISNKYLEVIL